MVASVKIFKKERLKNVWEKHRLFILQWYLYWRHLRNPGRSVWNMLKTSNTCNGQREKMMPMETEISNLLRYGDRVSLEWNTGTIIAPMRGLAASWWTRRNVYSRRSSASRIGWGRTPSSSCCRR